MRIVILFLLISSFAKAQLSIDTTSVSWGIVYGDKEYKMPENYISLRMPDSTIDIVGDTAKCIKLLFDRINQQAHENDSLQILIYAGVEFLNNIPDEYKSKTGNCKWNKYYSLLKKQGYRMEKTKSRKVPCK